MLKVTHQGTEKKFTLGLLISRSGPLPLYLTDYYSNHGLERGMSDGDG